MTPSKEAREATPRTDAKAAGIIGFYSCATVPAEFARELERELNKALASTPPTPPQPMGESVIAKLSDALAELQRVDAQRLYEQGWDSQSSALELGRDMLAEAILELRTSSPAPTDKENEIEKLWKQQGGVDPESGKAWLTPRMAREAARLQKHWVEEPAPAPTTQGQPQSETGGACCAVLCKSEVTWECVHGFLYCDRHHQFASCATRPLSQSVPLTSSASTQPQASVSPPLGDSADTRHCPVHGQKEAK